ncbi:PEBP-like protein [Poronia punctata]|nr:PEBP-like protein [Poronia punctata]
MAKDSPSIQTTFKAAKDATTLRIHFPETVVVTTAGANLTTTQAKSAPTFSVSASALKSTTSTRYIVVAIDIDAPFPSIPVLGPILHGIHVDLVAGSTPDADGFVPLEGPAEWFVPYIGPAPPKPSSAHRYMFLVFEQPETLDGAKIKSVIGVGPDIKLTGRMWWDQKGFEEKMGLGDVLAGNFFLARS